MGRFQNSLALAKASLQVLRDDKQLTLLPLLSGIATIVVAASFFIPAALVAHDGATGGFTMQPLDWVLALAGYLVLTFIVVFFNAALVYAADRHLHGEHVTIGEGRDALLRATVVTFDVLGSRALLTVARENGDLMSVEVPSLPHREPGGVLGLALKWDCLLYTSPSPRD